MDEQMAIAYEAYMTAKPVEPVHPQYQAYLEYVDTVDRPVDFDHWRKSMIHLVTWQRKLSRLCDLQPWGWYEESQRVVGWIMELETELGF